MENLFSKNLLATIRKAILIASSKNCPEVMPSHLFLAIQNEKGSLAYNILSQLKQLKKTTTTVKKHVQSLPKMNEVTLEVIQKASKIAFESYHSYVGTEHVLAALVELPKEELEKLSPEKLPIEKLKKHIKTVLKSSSSLSSVSKGMLNFERVPSQGIFNNSQKTIHNYTTDLTDNEIQEQINPVIGRESELDRLIQIICRKDKNNPIILGEAGTGKTAIVEGLAKKILEKKVPPILLNKKILSLDMGLLVAGTMYRGEFEARLKAILDEVENNTNIIVFIDEIHNIMGAGSSSGTMDTANLLKPLLARGKLRCIGATTPDEFKKFIETDPALERRFQAIQINEPTEDETYEILQGIKQNYQNFHKVTFADEALKATIELSQKYMPDKLLPDKAIDIIDEAAAKLKVNNKGNNKLLTDLYQTESQLEKLNLEKEKLIIKEAFHEAIKLKESETELLKLYEKIQEKLDTIDTSATNIVTKENIYEIVSQKTQIPINDLSEKEYSRLSKINQDLKQVIIGQDDGIEKIMQNISYSQLGLGDKQKPKATFLITGPAGVGKTSFAKELANQLYPNKDAYIHLDMSEFNDKFQTTKLVGAPAGYVGYRESNKFTDKIKRQPYSLILLDEIEKAHPDVLNLFSQILEVGHLTDSTGRKIDFSHTIIIMTTNVFHKNSNIGFEQDSKDNSLITDIKKQFSPQLVNRLSDVIHFNKLEQKHLNQILQQKITKIVEKLQHKGIEIEVQNQIYKSLTNSLINSNSGVHTINQLLRDKIEKPLLETVIKQNKNRIKIKTENNQVMID
ncbi:ATP-dependent Clp protease ATP-binding subunit [Candidatus Falkowbacteria bacterium]|jgi:ATP-dependent Clp protease ATP-binding subunit ClpC|nr:ATP-dependent Clp protease ATP-binding subunit [Candidatus Falkowbacteria bacterium]MBT7006930.1 ATP-dependent Clp protease ATP-binding subunit [Candidatus Falkowbacteria bacterium]